MSERNWRLFVEDIIECVSKIENYISGLSFAKFKNDDKKIDAVIRNLEIVGEAAKNIPVVVKEKYSNIDWNKIVGLRNRVIHDYFGVDLDII